MKTTRLKWIEFTLSYANVKCAYAVVSYPPDLRLKVKIVTHIPRGYYYSFLNDAIEEAAQHFEKYYIPDLVEPQNL